MKPAYLFISLPRHDADFTSTPWQLAKELATRQVVFFLDHPFTFWEAIKKSMSRAIQWRLKAYVGKDYVNKEGVVVIAAPFVWPINFLPAGKLYQFFKKWNEKILARRVNKVTDKFSIDELIYVNSFDFYCHGVHQHLNKPLTLKIYHCIDPIIKAYSKKHGQYLEPAAARESDMVIATAPALSQRFIREGINENSFLVPNAANVDLFSSQVEKSHSLLEGISGKVMGYLGSIERRIDYALLTQVLTLLPDWNLVLAGPVDLSYLPVHLLKHPRVHFTGAVPHQAAPTIINKFDVAIIPFLQDEVSAGIYPLKLFEYLATGKPVISTNFNPEILTELKAVLQVATTADDFANACEQLSVNNTEQQIALRKHVAANNTWTHRALQWETLVQDFLKQEKNVASSTDQK
ncbi:MAG: glycosyltransferase [Cytophagia bacterium]|nr:glycosyltransferase [Cytophagia bacterium]